LLGKEEKREQIVIIMTQTEEIAPSMDGVLSQKPETQLDSLVAIKDDIIGHSARKSVYINPKFMRPLIELLRNETTPAEVKVEATIVLGSLCHGNCPKRLHSMAYN
jgi:hypothetical protein